jgi:hypothetical protein
LAKTFAEKMEGAWVLEHDEPDKEGGMNYALMLSSADAEIELHVSECPALTLKGTEQGSYRIAFPSQKMGGNGINILLGRKEKRLTGEGAAKALKLLYKHGLPTSPQATITIHVDRMLEFMTNSLQSGFILGLMPGFDRSKASEPRGEAFERLIGKTQDVGTIKAGKHGQLLLETGKDLALRGLILFAREFVRFFMRGSGTSSSKAPYLKAILSLMPRHSFAVWYDAIVAKDYFEVDCDVYHDQPGCAGWRGKMLVRKKGLVADLAAQLAKKEKEIAKLESEYQVRQIEVKQLEGLRKSDRPVNLKTAKKEMNKVRESLEEKKEALNMVQFPQQVLQVGERIFEKPQSGTSGSLGNTLAWLICGLDGGMETGFVPEYMGIIPYGGKNPLRRLDGGAYTPEDNDSHPGAWTYPPCGDWVRQFTGEYTDKVDEYGIRWRDLLFRDMGADSLDYGYLKKLDVDTNGQRARVRFELRSIRDLFYGSLRKNVGKAPGLDYNTIGPSNSLGLETTNEFLMEMAEIIRAAEHYARPLEPGGGDEGKETFHSFLLTGVKHNEADKSKVIANLLTQRRNRADAVWERRERADEYAKELFGADNGACEAYMKSSVEPHTVEMWWGSENVPQRHLETPVEATATPVEATALPEPEATPPSVAGVTVEEEDYSEPYSEAEHLVKDESENAGGFGGYVARARNWFGQTTLGQSVSNYYKDWGYGSG